MKQDYFSRMLEQRAKQEELLRRELKQYREAGCLVCLNGRPCRSDRIVEACLRENSSYMRDYVSDDTERICKVNFVRIRDSKR